MNAVIAYNVTFAVLYMGTPYGERHEDPDATGSVAQEAQVRSAPCAQGANQRGAWRCEARNGLNSRGGG
jgi:hypothetical protein